MSPTTPPGAREPFGEGRRVKLADVAAEIPGASLSGDAGVLITGVRHDSREVRPGDLFVARAGGRTHGERFVADAIARGAVAVLVESGASAATPGVARIEAPDVPRALALASAAFWGHPTFALDVVGITGTNGKTTSTYLCRAAIDACGGRTGIVGTLGYSLGTDLVLPATHTSPEADVLAEVSARMLALGATHLAMEVSSIALAAARVDAVRFRVAALTNLTQDHLDYHGSMEAYGAAKARLFFDLGPGSAALNVDDAFGRELASKLAAHGDKPALPLARFSADPGAARSDADVAPTHLVTGPFGIHMDVRTPGGDVSIRSPLLGAHNVSNLLTALSIAFLLDLDVAKAAAALSVPIGVPGRLERCDSPDLDDVVVLVDYAHTPDALARVLASVRPMTKGKLTCVFGCGGDRDPTKRPLMGEAAGRGADFCIVTNDNPRSEAPRAIADAIVPGLRASGARFDIELDRSWAIERAVLEAAPGDVVVIAGKGHEPYQILGDKTVAFDDREEAHRALDARRLGPPTRRGGPA